MYVYKISRKNKQFGGMEICRSTGKIIFSDLFPSMQNAIEEIEDVKDQAKPTPVKRTRAKKAENKPAINQGG